MKPKITISKDRYKHPEMGLLTIRIEKDVLKSFIKLCEKTYEANASTVIRDLIEQMLKEVG